MATRGRLAHYNRKRDFTRTPEPAPEVGRRGGFRYLIQKHAARRLHYDLRLELDGVLKSWAVTRGPSLDPHDKRLAVEVEDHPVAYGNFEGTIPKGEYGGGTVMLWDEGSWEPIGDPHEGLKKGKLEFRLHGERLKGEWTLVRMRDRPEDKGRHNWLLIKHTDETAREGDADMLLKDNVTSITSGRAMEEIAAGDHVWRSRKVMPGFIPPQLATLVDAMPRGKDWVHEIKFDGYRALAYLQGGKVRIFTRTGQDWTHTFRSIADAVSDLPVQSAILDGEIVALGEDGRSSFKLLQQYLREGEDKALHYYVFDLLYLDGEPLQEKPLLERKRRLATLLGGKDFSRRIVYSEHVREEKALLKQACRLGLEGMVSKRSDAPYRSGRGTAWVKTKCHKRQEFVIGGFTLPKRGQRGIGALLIGYHEDGEFRYAGKVGTGFDNETSLGIRKKLDSLQQEDNPFASVPTEGRRGAHWVKPKLVCEVEFTEWTGDGRLRHPSFQGLREDKPAPAITRDKAKKLSRKNASPVTVGGISVTHPDRIIYPGPGITKQQLAEYYLGVAEHILPHVEDRPLSLIRCPEGIGTECFFQRHMAHDVPHIYDTGVPIKGREEQYLTIRDAEGLITLVQWGVVELHPWGCRADMPDKPDRILFDLDPDPVLPWKTVVEAAREVRMRMQELGLMSFVKTTGGKGLHVTVPMTRAYGWPTIKAFTRAIAESMEHDNKARYIARASKEARVGKIFVDYLRNDHTSTAVAPFSARAREGAPVAVPLGWEELDGHPTFTLENLHRRLAQHDPWEGFFALKQKIAPDHLKALKIRF